MSEQCQKMADQTMVVHLQSLVCQSAVEFDEPFVQHCGTYDVPSEPHLVAAAEDHDDLDIALVDTEDSRVLEDMELHGKEGEATCRAVDDAEEPDEVLDHDLAC